MTEPTPRAKPAPAVPDALLAQWRERGIELDFDEYTAFIAKVAIAWAWDQREALAAEDVREAEQRGADKELEACCEWLRDQGGCHGIATMLREARRPTPTPPTLRERALADVADALFACGAGAKEVTVSRDAALRLMAALQEDADG